MSAVEAVTGRRSVRRFLPDPVPPETIRAILQGAARAPSGTNSQPWHVHVVTGAARDRLSAAVIAAAEAGERAEEYPYFPADAGEPYVARRRAVGFALYALYGVARGDMAGRARAALRNFTFFGAPVGLFFAMERRLLYGSWLDMGMFMQNVMVLARAHGLETCAQQAWCEFGPVLHRELAIPGEHVIVSGMSLGRADWSAPENTLVSEREPVEGFTTWRED
jgi:nitroreductase